MPKLTFAATFQLMHLHSSVRSFASKEVTFTLHYMYRGNCVVICDKWVHKKCMVAFQES